MSQMNATVDTKKGYLMKKLSMETKTDSKLILSGTSSVRRDVVSEAKELNGKESPRNRRGNWVLRKGWRELRDKKLLWKLMEKGVAVETVSFWWGGAWVNRIFGELKGLRSVLGVDLRVLERASNGVGETHFEMVSMKNKG